VQDQRHRFVASGIYMLPREVELSPIVAIGSGGLTTFWRGRSQC
jgi:hypothetical protein